MKPKEKIEMKEKMDISRVLRIILFRSFTYLSLLVIIVFIVISLKNANRPHDVPGAGSNPKNVIAIIDGHSGYKQHIKGLRYGLLTRGIHTIPCLEHNSLEAVTNEDPIYIFGSDKVKVALKKFPDRHIIGFAGFLEKPASNYTGIFSGFDWSQDLKLYQNALPKVKRLGVLYTEAIPESREQVETLQKAATALGNLQIEAIPISENGKDLIEKLDNLLNIVDAFLGLVYDKNLEASLALISQRCLDRKMPFIGGGKMGAQMGALIAFDYNQEKLGREAAEIIAQLIKDHRNPEQIPIVLPKPEIFVNLSTSYNLNIPIPTFIRKEAKERYN